MSTGFRLAALSAAFFMLPAQAAVIQVEPGEVEWSVNGKCSLIEAIYNAEETNGVDQSGGDCVAGSSSGTDTIELSADSTYTLTNDSPAPRTGLPRIRSAVKIEANGSIIERDDSAGHFRLFLVLSDGSLEINHATLRNGLISSAAGGTIFNHGQLILNDVLIDNSQASNGPGGAIHNNGNAELNRVVIENSQSSYSGGGIHNDGQLTLRESTIHDTRSDAAGGALVNRGTLTLERSLIEGSTSVGAGGGIDNYTAVTLRNSTISGNTADGLGGGILVTQGTLDATHLTVAYNAGTQSPSHENAGEGSGIYTGSYLSASAINLYNTLLVKQIDGNNCQGSFTLHTTVSDDTTCAPSASSGTLIAALADNGGPTRSHALVEDSAAIDAGNNSYAGSLTSDQRGSGFARLIGDQVDVGAYEFGDNDGIDTGAEDSVPNPDGHGFGDGNGDGIPDKQQGHVASFDTQLGDGIATIASDDESSPLQHVSAAATPGDTPTNITFPYGFFSFTITNVAPGETRQVQLYLPRNSKINGYWKKNVSGDWVNIATSITQVGNKTRVVFPLTEGGPFDFDADTSTITDPGGPGILATRPVPTLPQWAAIMLALLMMAGAAKTGVHGLRKA